MFRLRLAYSFVAVIFVVASAFGQVTTGTPTLGSFGGGPFDTVNLGNLNVHFSIPVVSKAGRGMPFTYALSYDSSIWTQVINNGVTSWFPTANWGWRGDTEIATGYVSYDYTGIVCDPRHGKGLFRWFNFVYHDPFGTSHAVGGLAEIDQCQNTKLNLASTARDGSDYTIYYYVDGSGTDRVTSRSGSVINPPFGAPTGSGTATDANGNQITTDGSGKFYDTLSGTTPVLTVAGTSPHTFTYTSPSGNKAYSLNYSPQNVWTSFGCGIGEYQMTNVSMVSSISLPDGTQYTFTYEQNTSHSGYITGRLASVKLPTGGTISYTYTGANGGIVCADGSTLGLTRTTPDSSTPWTYVRSGSGSTWTTTVTDPLTDETIVNFEKDSSTTNATNNFFETQRVVKQGSNTLSTTITCYNGVNVGTPSSCYNTAVTSPIARATAFHYLPTSSGSQAETDTDYNSNGLVTDVYDYDYATGAVGGLLRHTHLAYATLGNGIVDRPSSVSTYDGGGNLKANTQYTYDEDLNSLTASGATQHVSITGSRGNLTTVAAQASGTATLYRKFTHYDTGITQISSDVSATNASTNPTTYNYSNSAASCDFAFPTSITEPMSLSRSMTWDCNGGMVLTTKDENQQQTAYSYDVMWRMNQVNYPDGGQVTTTYDLTANPPNIASSQKIDSSGRLLTTQNNLDGLGRVTQNQLTSDPSGTDYVDTTYNGLGQIASVSQPYRSGQTVYATSYKYDALGRVLQLTTPNGQNKYLSYNNRAMEVQEYSGWMNKETIYQMDGLGRNTTICEISSLTQLGSHGTPVNCGLDIAGTGFTTSYGYSALGNITSVVNASNSRAFTYDGLARLTSEQTPEAWNNVVYYSYDTQEAGDLYQRVAPAPNQTGSATVTTTYTHDALHRLTNVSYSDGTTPYVWLTYDQTQSPGGTTLYNTKGRLTSRGSPAGTHGVMEVFSYDPMGRAAWHSQCTPSLCGSTGFFLTNSYDYLGDPLNGGNMGQMSGQVINWTNTYDTAGRLSTVWTNWLSPTENGDIVGGILYNAAGQPISDSLGSGIQETWSYDGANDPAHYDTGSSGPYAYNIWQYVGSEYVYSTSDNINGSWTYTYDQMGRLSTSACTSTCPNGNGNSLAFSYDYDPLGNRWHQNVTAGSGPAPQFTFDTGNHLCCLSHDAAGNVTNDGYHSYAYDAESRITSVDGGNTEVILYNAAGRKVSSQTSSGTTEFVYDLNGHLLDLTTAGTVSISHTNFYEGGRLWASTPDMTNLYFNHVDWLGNGRAWSDLNKNTVATCTNLPFGDNYACAGVGYGELMHFTGQLRDGPLNLDQFPARNYAGVFGHWHTPDPAGLAAADPGNPQTWNRYAYVANNPLSNTDPLGLEIESCWGFDCGGVGGGGGCMGFTDGAGYPGENCGPYTVYLPVGPGGGGGGGGGSAPRPPSPPPGGGGNHGPWPGNQTTGLPQLPTQPLSLGDLMSFTPGAVTPDEIGLGTTICVVQPEVCVAGIITIGVIVYAPQIVSAIQQTISQSQTQAAPSTTTNNSQPCVPPAGTKCYETQSGHTHNGWGPHSHIWTRNQVPSTGKCFWNRGGGTQGTTQFPPAGMQSCSTYSTWPNN